MIPAIIIINKCMLFLIDFKDFHSISYSGTLMSADHLLEIGKLRGLGTNFSPPASEGL